MYNLQGTNQVSFQAISTANELEREEAKLTIDSVSWDLPMYKKVE